MNPKRDVQQGTLALMVCELSMYSARCMETELPGGSSRSAATGSSSIKGVSILSCSGWNRRVQLCPRGVRRRTIAGTLLSANEGGAQAPRSGEERLGANSGIIARFFEVEAEDLA